jgi:hypothetical protein
LNVELEIWRHYADNRNRQAIEFDLFANNVWLAAKTTLPQSITDYGN